MIKKPNNIKGENLKLTTLAFTLVELLAVIVILAVILVIAIPQIMNTIKAARLSSIKDSAMLIAEQAEKDYLSQQVLNKDYYESSIPCSDVAKLNDDYDSCTITYNNGIAAVTLKGKEGGKFSGIVCEGTKDNMNCGEDNSLFGLSKLGDYVTLVPNATSYTIPTSITGYNSEQEINPSELTLWRIINKNDDGTIELVSEYTSSTPISFRGVVGYANYINAMHKIASQYSKDGYTISTRMMGYDNQTLTISDTRLFDGTTRTSPGIFTTPSPIEGTGEEYLNGIEGDTLYLKDYLLVSNVYHTDTNRYGSNGLIAYKVNTESPVSYYISSRKYFDINAQTYNFSLRYINKNGTLYDGAVRYYSRNDREWVSTSIVRDNVYLRPIITLNSTTKISSGTGTKVDPYIL